MCEYFVSLLTFWENPGTKCCLFMWIKDVHGFRLHTSSSDVRTALTFTSLRSFLFWCLAVDAQAKVGRPVQMRMVEKTRW